MSGDGMYFDEIPNKEKNMSMTPDRINIQPDTD